MTDRQLLTQEQVDALPHGTEISVLWFGDMADTIHEHTLECDSDTVPYRNPIHMDKLVNVGKDSHNNWVWLTVKKIETEKEMMSTPDGRIRLIASTLQSLKTYQRLITP